MIDDDRNAPTLVANEDWLYCLTHCPGSLSAYRVGEDPSDDSKSSQPVTCSHLLVFLAFSRFTSRKLAKKNHHRFFIVVLLTTLICSRLMTTYCSFFLVSNRIFKNLGDFNNTPLERSWKFRRIIHHLEGSMGEYTSNEWQQHRKMSNMWPVGFGITRILTHYAHKLPGHWFQSHLHL